MKRICLLICACLALLAALVACDKGGEPDAHTHTYADVWSFDKDSHWYAATCEHADEKANVGTHVDAENDGVCDICAYGSDHAHDFAQAWSSDAENHWHDSACGHDVKDALGAHVDADNDDVCDVCGHGGGCEHPVAADAWLSDAEGHWHATSCSHNVKLDAAAHEDGNNDGVCDVCAWSDPAHTHTYKTEYSYDGQKHWFDADCGHTVKGEEQAHTDANNDGACDTCPYTDGCAHDYSTLWSVDGTHHWHDVICTHTIAPADKAEHTDANDDGVCDVCEYLDHEHTYDTEEWVFDNAAHWHAASCGCSLKADEAAHTDENNDGACDVCAWTDGCEHPVSDAWSYDGTHHWHSVTCTHTIEPADKAQHKDPDNDGACNVCGWFDASHTHTYASTLTVDADTHYYAATCGHTGARKDEVAHTDEDYDGKCDVCGGAASLQSVIDRVTSDASAGKVSSGSVITTNTYHFEDLEEPYVSVETVTYEFGQGYLHTYDGSYQRWFTLLDDGSVFAARMIDGEYEAEDATADSMAGYYFNGHFLYYNIEACGVEALLYNLYAYAQENASGGVNGHYEASTGRYGFDFYYYNGYESLYHVTVWFAFDAADVITDMHILSTVYSSYGQSEDGSYYVIDEQAVDYEYDMVFTQTVGARVAPNEHGPDKFLYTAFDLGDGKGTVYSDVITVEPGVLHKLYIVNAQPETAIAKLDLLQLQCSGNSSEIYVDTAWSGDFLYLKGIKAGTYTLTVRTANVTKQLTIVVGTPELESIAPQIYYKNDAGLYTTTVTTHYTLYAGQTMYFGAMANPAAANADFAVIASGGTLGSASITYGSQQLSVSTFAASEGTYTLTLTSKENGAITATLTVEVVPAPTVGKVLSGSYMADIFDYNVSQTASSHVFVTFAPESAGAEKGTVTLVRGTQTEVMSYAYEGGSIVLTHLSGDVLGYTLSLNEQYSVTLGWSYNDAQREQIMLEYNYTNRVYSETWVSAGDMIDQDRYRYTFILGDGGYVYDAEHASYPDILSQVDNRTGEITVTFLDDVSGTALAGIVSMRFDPDANTITLVLADQTVILTPYAGW